MRRPDRRSYLFATGDAFWSGYLLSAPRDPYGANDESLALSAQVRGAH